MKFAILGDSFVDITITLEADQEVQFGGDCVSKVPFTSTCGGSACNTAVHLSSLVKSTKNSLSKVHLFTCFSEEKGELWRKLIEQKCIKVGIDVTNIELKQKASTGTAVIFTKPTDHGFISYTGAPGKLSLDDVSHYFENIRKYDHLHLGGLYCLESLRDDLGELLARISKVQPNITISLDTNTAPNNEWKGKWMNCLPFVNIFSCNENEAKGITEKEELLKMFATLFEFGVKEVCVIKLGAKGAAFMTKNMKNYQAIAAKQVTVVDQCGAGDAFIACFLYQYFLKSVQARNSLENLTKSVKAAVKGGTKIVTVKGASSHILVLQDIQSD